MKIIRTAAVVLAFFVLGVIVLGVCIGFREPTPEEIAQKHIDNNIDALGEEVVSWFVDESSLSGRLVKEAGANS